MDKKILLVLIIGIPLLTIHFIVLEELTEKKYQESIDNFILGYDQGVNDTLSSLFNETEDCMVVPIFIENKTRNLIDFSCIQPPVNNFP